VHLAARTDLEETKHLKGYAANIEGVRNLVGAVRGCASVERCVYTSSQLVCRVGYIPSGETDYAPNTLYGQSKVMTEKIVRENDGGGVEWCIVRPTTVWGPWCNPHYRRFFDLIRKGYYFHVGAQDRYKSYGYVGNFCHQVAALVKARPEEIHRKTFYLADYAPTSLRQWADAFQQELGAPKIRTYPAGLVKIAAVIGDIFAFAGFDNFPLTSFRLNNILTEYVFDMTEMQRIVPQLPYAMLPAVRETADWIRSQSSLVT
jgi:nucleoside-diphosphate-sugar epimerase